MAHNCPLESRTISLAVGLVLLAGPAASYEARKVYGDCAVFKRMEIVIQPSEEEREYKENLSYFLEPPPPTQTKKDPVSYHLLCSGPDTLFVKVKEESGMMLAEMSLSSDDPGRTAIAKGLKMTIQLRIDKGPIRALEFETTPPFFTTLEPVPGSLLTEIAKGDTLRYWIQWNSASTSWGDYHPVGKVSLDGSTEAVADLLSRVNGHN